jgi:NTP pyrophosphatase (non-canonical NTP hydrolase)
LIQYEQLETVYGSQYSTINYIGSYYKGDNLRKIALVPLREITEISDIDKVVKSNANSILFILPNPEKGKLKYTSDFEKLINEIQIYLSEQTLYIPVYFTYETEELMEIVEQLREEYKQSTGEEKKGILNYLGINQNLLHFSLSVSEPRKIENLNLENLYGFLEGAPNAGGSNPIVAIVANYDSFGITPELSMGTNNNGSGVIAILELIRILSKFYENYENVIKFDILFALTSAGNLNYEGAQQFINSLDSNISENLQYVLCLNSLSNIDESDDLFLHISRLPKENEENANRLYKIFNTTSENMNFTLNYIKKKVYLSSSIVPWEHEQFSKKKILAATLSSIAQFPVNNFNRTLILDTTIDKLSLKRNIKFLSEALLAFLFDYDIKNFTIFKDDENLLDETNVETFITYLRKISRFPLNIQKGSQFNNDLFSFLNSYLMKTQRQVFEYKDIKFFDSNAGNVKIYSVKSKLIDLYLLLAILFYLFVIYVYTKVFY